MFCTQCGAQITENDKFCPHCGGKNVLFGQAAEAVKEEAAPEEPKAAEPVQETAAPEEPKVEEPVQETAAPEEPKVEEPKAEATVEEKLKEAGTTAKEKLNEAVDSAKKAGEEFAASDTVQNAKKEMNDIINEAKAASDRQSGQADENTAVPRESVSFLVDWFYWTGRRSRMKYLLVGAVTSVCSLALGSTGIFSLLFCYMSAVNLVKRLHDFEKPGWYAFLLMLAEYVLISLTWLFGLVGLGVAAAGGSLSGLIMWIIPLLLVWAIKLWVFFIPGTKGPNKYGPESR